MARGSGAWKWVGAITLVTACGGEPFVLVDDAGSADGQPQDVRSQDVTSDGPAKADLVCRVGCQVGSVCCIGMGGNASCAMGMGLCGTCDTNLRCASDENCPTLMPHCCIGALQTSQCNGNKDFVAQCRIVCPAGEARLCDPTVAASPSVCPSMQKCSSNPNDLQTWGLPQNTGPPLNQLYGVCVPQ